MNSTDTLLWPSDIAVSASAESGVIILEGPQGIAVTLTVAAAMATAQNLIEAALIAMGQERGDPTLSGK